MIDAVRSDASASAASPEAGETTLRSRQNGLLAGARILIGEASMDLTNAARASLIADGAAAVLVNRSVGAAAQALAGGRLNFAQIDAQLPGGDAVDLIRRVRFGELGDNPFLPMLLTTGAVQPALIDAALAAGVDDVLVKPFSVGAVAKRIRRLAVARKPFVAANGYIGPIRTTMDEAVAAAATFEPPNALSAAVTGGRTLRLSGTPEFQEAQQRLLLLRVEVRAREAAEAMGELLAAGPESETDETANARRQTMFRRMASGLRRMLADIPSGNLRAVVARLAALIEMAVGGAPDARRAGKLVVEIGEVVATVISNRQEGAFELPADIIEHMDRRFPALAAA